MKQKIYLWIAYKIPRRLVYWVTIRAYSETSIRLPTREVPGLEPADVLKTFE